MESSNFSTRSAEAWRKANICSAYISRSIATSLILTQTTNVLGYGKFPVDLNRAFPKSISCDFQTSGTGIHSLVPMFAKTRK